MQESERASSNWTPATADLSSQKALLSWLVERLDFGTNCIQPLQVR